MNAQSSSSFGTESVGRLLLRLAPPVMMAQLIQALYNIVDSYFVGQYSPEGLAALSVLFPIQQLISALSLGAGIGVNTVMSRYDGLSRKDSADEAAGAGLIMAFLACAVFALISCSIMDAFVGISLTNPQAQQYASTYGKIICGFSLGLFLEGNWTNVLRARGDTKTPMIAQAVGAGVNILMAWLLIFGIWVFPEMGIAGAAFALVGGQFASALIVGLKARQKIPSVKQCGKYVKMIYKAGAPHIVMNALSTIYVICINLILVSFSDEAVTVLGLYNKLQGFFLCPAVGITTCIIPVLSYNYAAGQFSRCRMVMRKSVASCLAFLGVGTLIFCLFPTQLLGIFAEGEAHILDIGAVALRIISTSYIPMAFAFPLTVFFQAIGKGKQSIFLSTLREIILLIPLAWIFSFLGLTYVWIAFPAAELIAAVTACILYRKSFLNELPKSALNGHAG